MMSGEDTVDVKIESLHIGDRDNSSSVHVPQPQNESDALYSPSIQPDAATATVSFGGSMTDMQIVSPQLCPTTGLPVIESKPSFHTHSIAWSGHRHLTLQQQHLFRRHTPVFDRGEDAWSGDLPEIVELTVRYRGHTGVGFWQPRQSLTTTLHTIPLQSDDWENATLRVVVAVHSSQETTPSVAACSTASSSSSILQQFVASSSTTLQQLWESNFPVPVPQKSSSSSCAAWEQIRQAVVACNPAAGAADDLSTIATRESWGDF